MNGFNSAMNTVNGGSHKPFGGVTPSRFRSCFDQRQNGRVPAMMRGRPAKPGPERSLGPAPKKEFKSCV